MRLTPPHSHDSETDHDFDWLDEPSRQQVLESMLLPPEEREYAASNILAFFAHMAALIVILAWLPPLQQPFDIHVPQLLARVSMEVPVDAIEELVDDEEELEPTIDETTAAAASGEEGRFGAEDSAVEESVLPAHDGPLVEEVRTEPGMALPNAIGQSGALTNIFGASNAFSDTFGSDFATAGVGDAFVMGRGIRGGMAMRGTGPGGGGDGLGRPGGVGAIDTGSGHAQRASIGRREQSERRPRVTTVVPRDVGNYCSRENIQRVVSQHNRGVRSCYERELQNDPNLSGRITASWTIGLDGRVISAVVTESTMNSRNVESCMLGELRRMRFDAPDGGQCVVSFPYTFRNE
jgi:hypothetical protein